MLKLYIFFMYGIPGIAILNRFGAPSARTSPVQVRCKSGASPVTYYLFYLVYSDLGATFAIDIIRDQSKSN
jgi:hypothetical protein